MNILKNTQATLSIVFSAGYADGTVTTTVTDAASRPVASGAATKDLTTPGRYTFALPPHADVASLTAAWSGSWGTVAQSIETHVEIVGAHLFSIAELRDFDDRKLADATEYPDALIIEHRDSITELFERVAGVSFIPKYQRDVLTGDGDHTLWVTKRRTNRVLAASAANVALTQPELAAIQVLDGRLVRTDSWWPRPVYVQAQRNVVVEYEHGYTVAPGRIGYVAKVLARYELLTADIGDRALSTMTDLGTVRLSVPSEKYPTGIPAVDAELGRWSVKATVM